MATLGHLAVGMAGARLFEPPRLSVGKLVSAMATLSLVSLAPDADVVTFALGIPYAATWGHRGAVHSLMFTLIAGMLFGGAIPLWGWSRWRSAVASALVMASHGILDAFTNGGLGVALFWPFSLDRLFAPWRPLRVAPIGLGMLSRRGLTLVVLELCWFAPLLIYALFPRSRLPRAYGCASQRKAPTHGEA